MNASSTPKPGPFHAQAEAIAAILGGEDNTPRFQLTGLTNGCIDLRTDGDLAHEELALVLHSVAHQLGAADPGAGLTISDADTLALATYLNMPSPDNQAGVHRLAQVVYARAEDLVNASRSGRRG